MDSRPDPRLDAAAPVADDTDLDAVKQRLLSTIGTTAPNATRRRRRTLAGGGALLGVGALGIALAVGLPGGAEPAPLADDGVIRPPDTSSSTAPADPTPEGAEAEIVSTTLLLEESLAALAGQDELNVVLTDRNQTIIEGEVISESYQRTVTSPSGSPHVITVLPERRVPSVLDDYAAEEVYAFSEEENVALMREVVAGYAGNGLQEVPVDPDDWVASFATTREPDGMWGSYSIDRDLGIWAASYSTEPAEALTGTGSIAEDGTEVMGPLTNVLAARVDGVRAFASSVLSGEGTDWVLVEGSQRSETIDGHVATCVAFEDADGRGPDTREPVVFLGDAHEICVDDESKLPLRSSLVTRSHPYAGISPQLADVEGGTTFSTTFEWLPVTADDSWLFQVDTEGLTEVTINDFATTSRYFATY
jgi:hypothetical protein